MRKVRCAIDDVVELTQLPLVVLGNGVVVYPIRLHWAPPAAFRPLPQLVPGRQDRGPSGSVALSKGQLSFHKPGSRPGASPVFHSTKAPAKQYGSLTFASFDLVTRHRYITAVTYTTPVLFLLPCKSGSSPLTTHHGRTNDPRLPSFTHDRRKSQYTQFKLRHS